MNMSETDIAEQRARSLPRRMLICGEVLRDAYGRLCKPDFIVSLYMGKAPVPNFSNMHSCPQNQLYLFVVHPPGFPV
jgi:hypothetical protein